MQTSFCAHFPEELTAFLEKKAYDHSSMNRHEWWCLNHLWRHVQSTNQIKFTFPVEVEKADPSDFWLSLSGKRVLVEVTKATYERFEQILGILKNAPEGALLELDPSLYSNRRIKKKDDRDAARKYIRYRGECLIGGGSVGDEPERSLADAIRAALRRKEQKYHLASEGTEAWLLIDAEEHFPGVDVPYVCRLIWSKLRVALQGFHIVFVHFGRDEGRCWQRPVVGA